MTDILEVLNLTNKTRVNSLIAKVHTIVFISYYWPDKADELMDELLNKTSVNPNERSYIFYLLGWILNNHINNVMLSAEIIKKFPVNHPKSVFSMENYDKIHSIILSNI